MVEKKNLIISAPVGGPVASLRSETTGLLSILQNVEERYIVYVQLMIFFDCLALLMIHSQIYGDRVIF